MKKFSKNRKGFTLAEEVVTVVLIGVLVATASGVLMHAMRIFCRNVITLNAQEKGIAVMEQLEGNLEYAKEISSSSTSGTNPYQVQLYLDSTDGKQYLVEATSLKYSNTDTGHTATNQICNLGTYSAQITVTEYGTGNNQVEIYLAISRNGTIYYSDKRIVELKNKPYVSGLNYDSKDGAKLYIEGLE
ncbi:MAG: type II secretion system protein [Ruminococcus sp.]